MKKNIPLFVVIVFITTVSISYASKVFSKETAPPSICKENKCVEPNNSDEIKSKEKQSNAVGKILRNKKRRDWSKTPAQEKAEDLSYLGDATIIELAKYLKDYDLGYDASETMLFIDANKAAPLIFASMPESNRNVQYHGFKYFIRQIQNKEPFDFSVEMHDAAVRCLKADTNADAAVQALLAIGLTGSKQDFSILEEYYNNNHPTDVWKKKLSNASHAALARLGNKKYITKIIDELERKVPDNLTLEEADEITQVIEKAAFSNKVQFIPLLCKHLDTPSVRGYDVISSPAWHVVQALKKLVKKTSKDDRANSIEYWKKRCVNIK